MRRIFLILALCLALPACEDSQAMVPPDGGRLVRAPGDTLAYRLILEGFGRRSTAAEFTVKASTSGWTLPVRQRMTTLSADFQLKNPTDWPVTTFKLWAWGVAGTQISKDSALIATWTVQPPDRGPEPPPGGRLDTILSRVEVVPDAAEMAIGDSLIFCALGVYADSSVRWLVSDGRPCEIAAWDSVASERYGDRFDPDRAAIDTAVLTRHWLAIGP